MLTTFVVSLSLLLASTPPETAAQEECLLYFAEKYDQAWTEAAERNVPVLVMDFDGWEGAGLDAFLADPSFLEAADRAVIILSSQHQYGEKAQIVRGELRTVCAKFGCVPAGTHRRMKQDVFRDFAEEGVLKTPLFVVATPQKEVVERLAQETPVSSVLQALNNGLRRIERSGGGRGLGRLDYEALSQGIDTIVKSMDRREWRPAVRTAQGLAKLKKGALPIHRRLDEVSAQLQEAGVQLIKTTEERWASGEHEAAILAMDETAFYFDGHPVGRTASSRLKGWLKSPEGKPHAKTVKTEGTARKLYFEGQDLEAAGEYRKALSSLNRLVKVYPDTLWAEQARSLIDLCEEALR